MNELIESLKNMENNLMKQRDVYADKKVKNHLFSKGELNEFAAKEECLNDVIEMLSKEIKKTMIKQTIQENYEALKKLADS
jgi:hypothetical protein